MESRAWQDLSINARRVVDFLLIEHMRHAGAHNGMLLAPRQQLREFGISGSLIDKALKEAEDSGLVRISRGQGRRPSYYTLMWLPLFDGTMPGRVVSPEQGSQVEGVDSSELGSLDAVEGDFESGRDLDVGGKALSRTRSSGSDPSHNVARNRAHKVQNRAHYGLSKPKAGLTTGSSDPSPLSRRSSYHGSHSTDLSAGAVAPPHVNGHARSPPAADELDAHTPTRPALRTRASR